MGDDETIDIARDPTPQDERAALEAEGYRLKNTSDAQDIAERKRYAERSFGITQTWIGFLIVLTIAQVCLKPINLGLGPSEFITVFTTTTASIFGFWLLVGNYLFRSK